MNHTSRLFGSILTCILGLTTAAAPAKSWGKALSYIEVPPLRWPALPQPTPPERPPTLGAYANSYFDGMVTGAYATLTWEGDRNFRMTARLGDRSRHAPFVVGLTCDESNICRPNDVYPTPPGLCPGLYLRLLPYRNVTMVDPCGAGAIPLR